MILEADALTDGTHLECDVCIVGAGPAGITLATELEHSTLRILLIAGGDVRRTAEWDALNQGDSVGEPYSSLETCRVRGLGGTTQVWGGWARPLDPSDFEQRDWVPESGWPFPATELDAVMPRAHEICGLGPAPFTCRERRETSGQSFPSRDTAKLEEVTFGIAPVRFGERHLPALQRSATITLLLRTTVTRVRMQADAHRVAGVECVTSTGNALVVAAKSVVLAAGGIENPRLLLASGNIGNTYDLVGRYFGDHLHAPIGEITVDDPATAQFFQPHGPAAHRMRGGLALTESVRRANRLLNAALTLHNAADPHDLLSPAEWRGGYESLVRLVRSVREMKAPATPLRDVFRLMRHADEAVRLTASKLRPPRVRRLVLGLRAEQVPCADSRVRLSAARDRFGVPTAQLDWRISEEDLASISATQRLVAEALVGTSVRMYSAEGPDGWRARLRPGAHHMGTTRMHSDPAKGVVDARARVHGIENLYLTGSSVFPTGGCVPPTLTLVALSVRLAREIRKTMAPDTISA